MSNERNENSDLLDESAQKDREKKIVWDARWWTFFAALGVAAVGSIGVLIALAR